MGGLEMRRVPDGLLAGVFQSPDADPSQEVLLLHLQDQQDRVFRGPGAISPENQVLELAGRVEVLEAPLDLPVGDLVTSLEPQGPHDGGDGEAVIPNYLDAVHPNDGNLARGRGVLCSEGSWEEPGQSQDCGDQNYLLFYPLKVIAGGSFLSSVKNLERKN